MKTWKDEVEGDGEEGNKYEGNRRKGGTANTNKKMTTISPTQVAPQDEKKHFIIDILLLVLQAFDLFMTCTATMSKCSAVIMFTLLFWYQL